MVEKILKVTAGSTPEIGIVVDELYKSCYCWTHLVPCIKVEAAKVIENSLNDINNALQMNSQNI
jgi:UDP-N-acetyl-D-galactosamine dehydrogenase